MERGAFSAAARDTCLTLRANIPGLSEIPYAGLGEGGSNGQLGDFSGSDFEKWNHVEMEAGIWFQNFEKLR